MDSWSIRYNICLIGIEEGLWISILTGGFVFVSKGGSVQISAKALVSIETNRSSGKH